MSKLIKIKMPKSAFKRAGLFSSISIVIGSIVGIGIFIKNGSIFSMNNGNSYAILGVWIIGAIIAILKGYSFLEISSIKKDGESKGLSLWMSKLVGKHSRSVTQMFLIALYLGVLAPILIGYSLNFFFMFLGRPLDKKYLYIVMFLVPAFFVGIQLISKKLPERLNIVLTIIKILPLLLVAFTGMFNIQNGGGIGNNMAVTNTPQTQNLTLGMLVSLPSVLFSFDAFLNVASINEDSKGNENVSKSIIFGMVAVGILYILITISQINFNRGFVSSSYDRVHDRAGVESFQAVYAVTGNNAFKGLVEDAMGKTMNKIFIFIVSLAGFGVINIIMMAGSSLTESSLPKRFKNNRYASSLAFLVIVYAVTGSLIGLEEYELANRVSGIQMDYMNRDVFDMMSNIPVIMAFSFYSVVLIGALVNRKRNTVQVEKRKGFIVTAIISIIMTVTVISVYIGYSVIYQSIVDYQQNKILVDSTVVYCAVSLILFTCCYIKSRFGERISKSLSRNK